MIDFYSLITTDIYYTEILIIYNNSNIKTLDYISKKTAIYQRHKRKYHAILLSKNSFTAKLRQFFKNFEYISLLYFYFIYIFGTIAGHGCTFSGSTPPPRLISSFVNY